MHVQERLTREVAPVPSEATLQEVAAKMRDNDCGALPVFRGDRMVGIITDRDVVVRAIAADGADARRISARRVMSKNPVYCFHDQGISEAARIMEKRRARRLIVLNRKNKCIGIVSLADLAREGDRRLAAQALKGISQPSHCALDGEPRPAP